MRGAFEKGTGPAAVAIGTKDEYKGDLLVGVSVVEKEDWPAVEFQGERCVQRRLESCCC